MVACPCQDFAPKTLILDARERNAADIGWIRGANKFHDPSCRLCGRGYREEH